MAVLNVDTGSLPKQPMRNQWTWHCRLAAEADQLCAKSSSGRTYSTPRLVLDDVALDKGHLSTLNVNTSPLSQQRRKSAFKRTYPLSDSYGHRGLTALIASLWPMLQLLRLTWPAEMYAPAPT